jgi:ATPase subunit of ABC transporter with duplicated ATPase domains
MPPDFIFTMKGVHKAVPLKREIPKGIWLSFYVGAKIGVLGPNGAGKSTLLRIMAEVDSEFSRGPVQGRRPPADGTGSGRSERGAVKVLTRKGQRRISRAGAAAQGAREWSSTHDRMADALMTSQRERLRQGACLIAKGCSKSTRCAAPAAGRCGPSPFSSTRR